MKKILELQHHPLCQASDLGKPIPESPHAVSVALPLWDHVVGYEEGRPEIKEAMQLGYPRFMRHPIVAQLENFCLAKWGIHGETCLVAPSRKVALRCIAFVEGHSSGTGRIQPIGFQDLHAVFTPEEFKETLDAYWQHTGEVVSSRWAKAVLEEDDHTISGLEERAQIRKRISSHTGADTEDVYLFPTGMAALAMSQRILHAMTPGAKTIQLGVPYVDLMKLQEKFGSGFHFFSDNSTDILSDWDSLFGEEPIAGVFTDLPGNPLLGSADVTRLYRALKEKNVPLVIDETIGTFYNVDALSHADMVMSSLTKNFSGVSDLLAGSLVLNRTSPHYAPMKAFLDKEFEDLLWGEDARVLEERSRDFSERMEIINGNAAALAEYLNAHELVGQVYYPTLIHRDEYEAAMKPGGGYGCLMSVVLRDVENAPAFYDALQVSKGPSLGTNYTLACPYTLLAHFDELEWAEEHGMSRYLVRISVGLEPIEELKQRFSDALHASQS
jgi:cystathionine gamma-synthase